MVCNGTLLEKWIEKKLESINMYEIGHELCDHVVAQIISRKSYEKNRERGKVNNIPLLTYNTSQAIAKFSSNCMGTVISVQFFPAGPFDWLLSIDTRQSEEPATSALWPLL